MITVKKSVLENFVKKIVESRSDGNSYADMTGTMFDNFEEEPIKPTEMMSTQLSVEAPPVDDPEYIPGTTGELGRAAQIISGEVPEDQIEKVYRQFHKILDSALDRHDDNKYSDSLAENLLRLLESSHDPEDEYGDEGDAADQWLKQQAASGVDIESDDEEENNVIDDFGGAKNTGYEAGTKGAEILQVKKVGDENVSQIEEFEKLDQELRSKGVMPSNVNTSKMIEQRLKYVVEASRLAYTEEDIPEELQTLADAAKEWEFDHPDAPKYIDAVFLAMHAVYEVNYQLIVANHGLEYGGLEIKEKDTGFGKKLDIGVKEAGAIGSREHNAGIIKDIQSRYGLVYDNVIRYRSVYNMTDDQLDDQIFKVVKGLNQHNPIFKTALTNYSGAIEKSGDAAMKELSQLLRMAYKEDVKKEEVQVDHFIAKFFSKVRVKEYYNLTKFTYHAWKDADSIKRDYPEEILNLMKRSKFYRAGIFSVSHPNIPEKIKEYDDIEMLEAIKTYVDAAVTASIDFHESQLLDQEAKEGDYEPTPEEVEKKKVAKQIKTLEKEANPSKYTHIAPLYGFSGESGLRQWVLKFPERKMRLMRIGKSTEDNFPGAKRFVEITEKIYDTIVRNLPLYLNFLKYPEQAEIFTKAFMNLRTKDKKLVGDIGDADAVKAQMDEFIRIFEIARQDLKQVNETLMELTMEDISIVAAAIEEQEPIPIERLDPDIFKYMTEEELVDMVKAYMAGMYSIGGAMARSAVGDILSDVITNTDKPWKLAIAQELKNRYENMDDKLAFSLSEHFMGKKNPPDFDKPNKSGTKKFLDLGISESEFYSLYAEAIKLYDDIISGYIGKKEKDARSLLARLQKAEIEGVLSLPKEQQMAVVNTAHEVYPFIIAMGIKSWDDMQRIEDELSLKRKEVATLKQQPVNEVRSFIRLIERLL
jgi:hypothetical protein